MTSRSLTVTVLGLAALVLLVDAYPRPQSRYAEPAPVYRPAYEAAPQIEARAGYGKPNFGRVRIQAYRGPSKGKGYNAFAPWGYYVTQPEDDEGYGYH